MQDDIEIEDRRYVLQDRDGDYVERIDSTPWMTVSKHFIFTKDQAKAEVFTHDDLYSRLATNPPGVVFIAGFRGRLVRIV